MSVFMLQTLAVERRTPSRATKQESSRTTVTGCPSKITNTLKTEHRVIDIKGDHRHVIDAVRGGGGDPRRHSTGLVDAFLQNLALLVLLVEHQLVGILWAIELSHL